MTEYIVLGFIQGIFEWLPVSSEGVLTIASHLLGLEVNPVDLALFLHLGTSLSILFYFRKDWLDILKDRKLIRFLIITTGISLILGFPLYKIIHGVAASSMIFFLTGFALLITAFFHREKPDSKLKSDETAILTGILQALAVIPGVSRSGATMFSLAWGEERSSEDILRISYLASLPVVLASSAYLLIFSSEQIMAWPALIVSAVVGFFSLKILLKLAQKIDFFWLVIGFSLLSFVGGVLMIWK